MFRPTVGLICKPPLGLSGDMLLLEQVKIYFSASVWNEEVRKMWRLREHPHVLAQACFWYQNCRPSHSSFYFLLAMWLWDQLTFVLKRRNRAINSFLQLVSFRVCKEAFTGTKSRERPVTRKYKSFSKRVGNLCVCISWCVHEQIFVYFMYMTLSIRFIGLFVRNWR